MKLRRCRPERDVKYDRLTDEVSRHVTEIEYPRRQFPTKVSDWRELEILLRSQVRHHQPCLQLVSGFEYLRSGLARGRLAEPSA